MAFSFLLVSVAELAEGATRTLFLQVATFHGFSRQKVAEHLRSKNVKML